MELPIISVVVPVYNVEKYLEKCLNSILEQTYKNFEVILVDDGSSDCCFNICEQYAKKDTRIKAFHKKNGGLADARNYGIKRAIGNYITFIDSDDFVKKEYLEFLLSLLEKHNADISMCGNFRYWEGKKVKSVKKVEVRVFSGLEAVENLLYQKNIENSAWGKLYKRELFDNIQYPKGKLYEDLGTTYKIIFNAERVVWSSIQKYFYLQRESSIMSRKFSNQNMDRVYLSEEILQFVHNMAPSIEKSALSRYFISNIQILREIPYKDISYEDQYYEIMGNISQLRKGVLLDRNAKNINRLIALSSYMPINCVKKLGGLYKKIWS